MEKAEKVKLDVEPKTYRKLEQAATRKNMTVQEYVDFLFKDFPPLGQKDIEQDLDLIFGFQNEK